jgi:hypothetical protein
MSTQAGEPVDRSRGGCLGRAHALGKRAQPQGPLVDKEGQREPLGDGERGRVELFDAPALAQKREAEPLDRFGQCRYGALAHSWASRGVSNSRRRQGVTNSAMMAASSAAAAPIQKAVTKPDSAGTGVRPIR